MGRLADLWNAVTGKGRVIDVEFEVNDRALADNTPPIQKQDVALVPTRKDPNSIVKSITPGDGLQSSELNKPIWTNWQTERAIKHGLKASSWVFACINKIADSASSIPMVAETRQPDGSWVRAEGHPIELLLNDPNDNATYKQLSETEVFHLFLGGNALVTKLREPSTGIVTNLWNVSPDRMKPVLNRQGIAHYEYRVGHKKIRVDREDVIHIRFTDPENQFWGLAPMEAAAKTIDTEVEAVAWNKASLQNRAVSDGVLSYKHDLSEEQWLMARRRMREQQMGSRAARMPWVLGNDVRWQTISMSPVDMDYIDGRKMTRVEICAVFNTPPPVVGILDQATYSNFDTAYKIFWRDNIKPLWDRVAIAYNKLLVPDFGDAQTLRIMPDFSGVEVLRAIPESTMTSAKDLFGMGVPMSIINDRLGMGIQQYSGWDISYVGNVPVTVGQVDTLGVDERLSHHRQPHPTSKRATRKLRSALSQLLLVESTGTNEEG